jgi:hypothetical protein
MMLKNDTLLPRAFGLLLSLVPGLAVNRQQRVESDAAVLILAEGGGNATSLIESMLNINGVGHGAAAYFERDLTGLTLSSSF